MYDLKVSMSLALSPSKCIQPALLDAAKLERFATIQVYRWSIT
jgi:hypothetical protein